jgi:AbrB family looped-hinge helix DNA binding protein
MDRSTLTGTVVTLGAGGQVTIPLELCEELEIRPGDQLRLVLTDDGVLIVPRKASSLSALRALQRAFAESGITEEELQAEGRRIREELSRARHGTD